MTPSIKHFKSVVFIVRQAQVLAYFPFATSLLWTAFIFDLLFSPQHLTCVAGVQRGGKGERRASEAREGQTWEDGGRECSLPRSFWLPSPSTACHASYSQPSPANKRHAWPRPLHNHIAHTSLRRREEAAETIWHTVNNRCVDIHSIFFYSLVICRHYFTGNGKVSCILHVATISNWFPNNEI